MSCQKIIKIKIRRKMFCNWCPVWTLWTQFKIYAPILVNLDPARFLSKVFIHHLCLYFFILAPLLITIKAVLQIIKPSELSIVAKHYSCNRLNISEKKFWSGHRCFINTVHKQLIQWPCSLSRGPWALVHWITGSNPAWGMGVCPRLSMLYCPV
jgi:hypothetical protein